ncbi:hypothetical protein N7478_009305 [Penicillium angulare]|uniref:uncharacterized protein n=1 Tax=Penicillium angulare TaxID=116970 RepID=UPI002540E37D|nr:uncharacterized protein N7478_009305 [Penicillium angulare]KAJ5266497.1 hypothetical protein N7478_009305 [Penicillium angulare]
MDPEDEEVERRRIIRRFSWKTRSEMPGEPLIQGLATKVDYDASLESKHGERKAQLIKDAMGVFPESEVSEIMQWKDCFDSLEESHKTLQERLLKFQQKTKLPTGDKTTQHGFRSVSIAVREAQSNWQKRHDSGVSGKAKKIFFTVSQAVSSHSYLLDLLPGGDNYASVIVGALSTLARATTTYQSIASEISDYLDEVSDQVRSFHHAIKRHPESEYIKCHIAIFYNTFFQFLIDLLTKWYDSSWKRLSHVFGSSFLDGTLRPTVKKLEKCQAKVYKESDDLWKDKVARYLYLLGARMEDCFEGMELERPAHGRRTHGKSKSYLNASQGHEPQHKISAIEDEDDMNGELSELDDESELQGNTCDWDAILETILHFDQYVRSASLVLLVQRAKSLSIGAAVYTRVHQWASEPRSEALWINGPVQAEHPSSNTLASAFMIQAIKSQGLWGISFIVGTEIRRGVPFSSSKELVALVYSLIYQAVQNIQENEDHADIDDIDFSISRFEALTGQADTLADAISVLGDLLQVTMSLQYYIIDGLELLERNIRDPALKKRLSELVNVLCNACRRASDRPRVTKVLFTTNGFSKLLKQLANKRWISDLSYEDDEEDQHLRLKFPESLPKAKQLI